MLRPGKHWLRSGGLDIFNIEVLEQLVKQLLSTVAVLLEVKKRATIEFYFHALMLGLSSIEIAHEGENLISFPFMTALENEQLFIFSAQSR